MKGAKGFKGQIKRGAGEGRVKDKRMGVMKPINLD